jgi:hypothetical protein
VSLARVAGCQLRASGWRWVLAFCPVFVRRAWLARESGVRFWVAAGSPSCFRPSPLPSWFWVLEFLLSSPFCQVSFLLRSPQPLAARVFFVLWPFRWLLVGALVLRLVFPLAVRVL